MSVQPIEGNPVDSGGTGANPSPSDDQSQPSAANFTKAIADLQRKIDAQDGEIRALKSGKDKAVDRAVKSQEETLAKIARYLDVDEKKVQEAQRQSVLDDLVAERLGNVQHTPPIQGRVEGAGVSVELQFIDTALELPANDSRVTELKLKYAADPTEYLKQAVALKASFKQPTPSPAEQLPLNSALSPDKKDTAALTIEYKQKMREARGNKSRLSTVRDDYQKKGVKVWEVDFS